MKTTVLNFNQITIVINECEPNEIDTSKNNAYTTYHKNNVEITDWDKLTRLEQLCTIEIVKIFCEENNLVNWSN